ncbi:YlzJ-like family protein [Paenibacillus pinihumi]|uniref:YlzJ-like family protein n=1 Tax=Paenibacillus pinihumi TaxID=669462 RepID=UPI000400E790|nr:YlzJ-like family protein [Paenibacillus pinihumi]
MTLYTSMPLELVLSGHDQEREPWIEIQVGGVMMQVEPTGHGIGKIVRIINGSLEDYLRPELSPGRTIIYANIHSPNT